MTRILVSGLINVETTLHVEGYPIHYEPVRYPFFGVNSTVSGVGYNVAKALITLGEEVDFLSLIGRDSAGQQVRSALAQDGISGDYVIAGLEQTPQSVILYDPAGRRSINVDLKDIQERSYPPGRFEAALDACSLAVLCNINFTRPYLSRAKALGKPVATDVHVITDLEDGYNRDYMQAADILFMSDEALPCPPEEWLRRVNARYGPEVAVIGLGAQGALLSVRRDNFLERIPPVATRPIVNTIGAGDALFSAFVHSYLHSRDPYQAIRKAVVFASYKIGEKGAAQGFLSASALDELAARLM
jgi:sugar/nucleoside kinase (ribokinase family)